MQSAIGVEHGETPCNRTGSAVDCQPHLLAIGDAGALSADQKVWGSNPYWRAELAELCAIRGECAAGLTIRVQSAHVS